MMRGRKRTSTARTCHLLFSCAYTESRGVRFGFKLAVGRETVGQEPYAWLSVNVSDRREVGLSISIGMSGPVQAERVRSIPYTTRNNGVYPSVEDSSRF